MYNCIGIIHRQRFTTRLSRSIARAGCVACGFLLFASIARADTLDTIRQRGTLIWGADQEGGGPYLFPDPQNPSHVIGFEVELADLIAGELGVRAQLYQADWNTLPEFLRSSRIDVILNGYEWTAARAAQMLPTRPYYIYRLQLLARANDDRIKTFDDLLKLPGGKHAQVSVLSSSAPAIYLREKYPDAVDLVEYDGNTNAMLQVSSGVHDASLQDLPIAIFYRNHPAGKGLRFAGDPVGRGYYVMYARSEDTHFVAELNRIIEKVIRDGRLKTIYERYGLWDSVQNELLTAETPHESIGPAKGWTVVQRYGPLLVKSACMTVLLSVSSMPIAILLGLLIALGRLYGPKFLRGILAVYVEVLRGTPVMLQLYVIFFLLPKYFHMQLNPIVAAIIGLAINYSAYEAEVYRAGLQAIPRGQMEAALALGLRHGTALRRIIVPQAMRIVLPPVTNDFIALFKDTSICSVIAVTELTKQYNMMANSTGAILELATMTALLYLAMSYPLSLVARWMEAKLTGLPKIS